VYTLFMMLGGMFMPFLMGVIFLGEPLTVWGVTGAVLIVIALVIPAVEASRKKDADKQKGSALFYILCVLLFLINGGYSCVSKLHQIGKEIGGDPVNLQSLLVMVYIVEITVAATSLLVTRRKGSEPVKKDGRSVLYSGGFALFSGLAGLALVSSAAKVSATVMFPVVTGGTIVFSALCGRIFFREKLNKSTLAQIVLAVAATVLFVF